MCSLYELQKKEENETRLQLQSLLRQAKRGEKVAAKLTANEKRKVIFGDGIMEMDIWKMNWKKTRRDYVGKRLERTRENKLEKRHDEKRDSFSTVVSKERWGENQN